MKQDRYTEFIHITRHPKIENGELASFVYGGFAQDTLVIFDEVTGEILEQKMLAQRPATAAELEAFLPSEIATVLANVTTRQVELEALEQSYVDQLEAEKAAHAETKAELDTLKTAIEAL